MTGLLNPFAAHVQRQHKVWVRSYQPKLLLRGRLCGLAFPWLRSHSPREWPGQSHAVLGSRAVLVLPCESAMEWLATLRQSKLAWGVFVGEVQSVSCEYLKPDREKEGIS